LGDVVIEGDDILGDGVNVAARLEGLAEPGGLCLSGAAHDHIAGKIQAAFENAGEHLVKNIAQPLRVWRWRDGPRPLAVSGQPTTPAIAVLAFTNMSGDPEQEYFADGITEDIITALSKWRWFFVIARNSTFVYKGRSVDIKQVARELGVHYVVEGSVRKSGNRVRITAQLIEAATAKHVWADRYDRELDDIFALQDEITERIVTAIDPALRGYETQRAIREPAIKAWDHYLRGASEAAKYEKEANRRAREHFEEAIRLDPDFALAHAYLANVLHFDVMLGWAEKPDEAFEAACQIAERAAALDDREPMAHTTLAVLATQRPDYEMAIAAGRRAVELNPNFARGQGALGRAYVFACRAEEAVRQFETFRRLSPHDPIRWVTLGGLATAHHMLGNYESAVSCAHESLAICPKPFVRAQMILVASLARLGRTNEAKQAFEVLHRLTNGDIAAHIEPFRDKEYVERLAADIRSAQP
jgi:adenylate cyclase